MEEQQNAQIFTRDTIFEIFIAVWQSYHSFFNL